MKKPLPSTAPVKALDDAWISALAAVEIDPIKDCPAFAWFRLNTAETGTTVGDAVGILESGLKRKVLRDNEAYQLVRIVGQRLEPQDRERLTLLCGTNQAAAIARKYRPDNLTDAEKTHLANACRELIEDDPALYQSIIDQIDPPKEAVNEDEQTV